MKYSISELINNVCERGFNNADKNRKKIENCGFKSAELIPLFGNYSMKLVGVHGCIRKEFYKGKREVTKATVLKAYERLGLE